MFQITTLYWYLNLATAEDIILRKLYWFQLGGGSSERQWRDVLGVLQVQKEKLDYSYLQRGARQMVVAALLEQAIKDAGEAENWLVHYPMVNYKIQFIFELIVAAFILISNLNPDTWYVVDILARRFYISLQIHSSYP